jgi:hypothetical protein
MELNSFARDIIFHQNKTGEKKKISQSTEFNTLTTIDTIFEAGLTKTPVK